MKRWNSAWLLLLFAAGLVSSNAFAIRSDLSAYPTPPLGSSSVSVHSIHISLAPGSRNHGSITITNASDQSTSVILYAVDAAPTFAGSHALRKANEEKIGVGAWTKLDKSAVTLVPHSSQNVSYTVTVPQNVSLGDHAGGIIVEPLTVPNNTVHNGVTLTIQQRFGIQEIITVPGVPHVDTRIRSFKLVSRHKLTYLMSLHNNGNTISDGSAYVVLTSWLGATLSRTNLPAPRLLPGTDADVHLESISSRPIIDRPTATMIYEEQGTIRTKSITFWWINWWMIITIIICFRLSMISFYKIRIRVKQLKFRNFS